MTRYAASIAVLLFGGLLLSEFRTGVQISRPETYVANDVSHMPTQSDGVIFPLKATEVRSVAREINQVDDGADSPVSRDLSTVPEGFGEFLDPEWVPVREGGPRVIGDDLEPDETPETRRSQLVIVGKFLHPDDALDTGRSERIEVGVEKEVGDDLTFGQPNRVNIGSQLYP